MILRQLKPMFFLILLCALLCPQMARATVTDYVGDPTGFAAATAGLGSIEINFDNLNEHDVITNQYDPPVVFSTWPDKSITAERSAYGPNALSAPYCAVVEDEVGVVSTFTMQFSQPVWGASAWILDLNPTDGTASVRDAEGNEIVSVPIEGGGYDFFGVVSDSMDIGSIIISTIDDQGDGIGFDDVTVVPEPATLSLLGIGCLVFLKAQTHVIFFISSS